MTAELDLRLQAAQGRAFRSRATEILYGGAAGGGKSHLMRIAAIVWCLSIPGLQVYLFRRLFPDLRANHMEGPTSFPQLLAPMANAGRCTVNQGQIRFNNGSAIHLAHCQYEKDLLKYQGTEMHVLMIDELTHFTEYMYRFLRGRVRMTGLKIPPHLEGRFPRILCGSNPGSVGHHWVKRTFVKRGSKALFRMPPKEGGLLRQFIPARLEDNPALADSDPDYVNRLEGLGDPMLVRAMKEGDWNVIAGSMFGATWRNNRHTCAPFAIPAGWAIWRGSDDGFVKPAACYWLTQDPDLDTVYVIRELYRPGMLPEDFAAKVLEGDKRIPIIGDYGVRGTNQEILDGILDSAAWADTGQALNGQKVPSRGKQMNDLGCKWKPAEKPPGSRIQRCQNLHRLLAPNKKDPRGRPGIIFFDTCEHAIETIPTLPRDTNDPEDVDTDAEDHAYDGVCYGLQRVKSGIRKVKVKGL